MNILIIIGAKYLIFLILLISAIYFFRQDNPTKKKMLLFGIVALPLIYFAALVMSKLYFDPRPFASGHFIPLIPHAPDNGFPSDHALLSGAVAMIIFYLNRKTGAILWILAVLVGVSRVLASVHHTVDILGSFLLSATLASAVYYLILPRLMLKFISKK